MEVTLVCEGWSDGKRGGNGREEIEEEVFRIGGVRSE
jgi:hypothetical protein